MSYFANEVNKNFLSKIKTTKDLIYKDKILNVHDIEKSYKDTQMQMFTSLYKNQTYYYNNPFKELKLIEDEYLAIHDKFLEKNILNNNLKRFFISEIQSSLYIEGIRSSKKSIKQSLSSKNDTPTETMHSNFNQALNFIFTTKEISESTIYALYIILMKDIDLKDNKLDCIPYRKNQVEIGDQDLGIKPDKIKDSMDELIAYINDVLIEKEHPEDMMRIPLSKKVVLRKAWLIHYHFELIHPYYDGNGRMGRLLVIWFMYINNHLNLIPFFSEGINLYKKQFYYPAFKNSKHKEFKNDITYFVASMNCIMIAQCKTLLKTKEIEDRIKNKYGKNVSELQRDIIKNLASKDKNIFYKSTEFILGIDEINKGLISKALSKLVGWKALKEINNKPKEYKLVW